MEGELDELLDPLGAGAGSRPRVRRARNGMTYRELLLEAAHSFSSSETPFLDAVLCWPAAWGCPKKKNWRCSPIAPTLCRKSFYDMADGGGAAKHRAHPGFPRVLWARVPCGRQCAFAAPGHGSACGGRARMGRRKGGGVRGRGKERPAFRSRYVHGTARSPSASPPKGHSGG